MAPETLTGGMYSQLADLYSFGIVMWKIAAQKEPWPDVHVQIPLIVELSKRLNAGILPPVSDEYEWPREYVKVMRWCWSDAAARPAHVRPGVAGPWPGARYNCVRMFDLYGVS